MIKISEFKLHELDEYWPVMLTQDVQANPNPYRGTRERGLFQSSLWVFFFRLSKINLHWVDSPSNALQADTISLVKTSYDVKWRHLTHKFGSASLDFTIFLGSQEVMKINTKSSQNTYETLVQSLNSPFFPLYILAEPGQAKRESRITCMRMLRTPFFLSNRGKNHIWKYFPDSACGAIFRVII